MPETRSKGRRRKSILQRIKPFFGRLRRKDAGLQVRSPTSVSNFWHGDSINEQPFIPEVNHEGIGEENRGNEEKSFRGVDGHSSSSHEEENEGTVRIRCLDKTPVKNIFAEGIKEFSVGKLLRDFSHPEPTKADELDGKSDREYCSSLHDKADPTDDEENSSQQEANEESFENNQSEVIPSDKDQSKCDTEDVDIRSVEESKVKDDAKPASTDTQNCELDTPLEEEQHDEASPDTVVEEFEAQSQSSATPFEDCLGSLCSNEEDSNTSFETVDEPKTERKYKNKDSPDELEDKDCLLVEYHKEQNEPGLESDEESPNESMEDNAANAESKENQLGPEELFARGDVVIVDIIGGAYASCGHGRINDIRKRVQVAIQHSDGTSKLHWLARGSLSFQGSPFPPRSDESTDEVKTRGEKDASESTNSERRQTTKESSSAFQINDRVYIVGGKYKKYKLGTVVEVKTSVKVALDGFDGKDPWLRKESLKLCHDENSS